MSEKKSHGRRNWAIVGVILVAVIVALSLWRRGGKAEITYGEVPVSKGDMTVSILATGTVEPENRLEIKPPIAGRAEQVLVDEGARVKKGQVLVWMSSTERAALLDAARARGPEELKKWEDYYKPTPVLAPISGTIIQRNIQPGQTFATSDAILVMSDHLTVQAQVDETDIAEIKLKEPASITLDAYPKNVIPGQVDKIAYDAKTVNNVTTYIVDVLPQETPAFMRSGMTANVDFVSDEKDGVLILPSEAIKKNPDGSSYVLQPPADKGDKPVPKPIRTGISDGKRTEIVSGLTDGEVVLVPQIKIGGKGPQGTNPFSPFHSRKPAK